MLSGAVGTRCLVAAAIAVAAIGCGAGGAARAVGADRLCPGGGGVAGSVHVSSPGDVARLSGCTAVGGDLVVDGAAVRDLDALSSLARVAGSVRIGPTSALVSTGGLAHLARIGGSLVVDTNLVMEGIYLPALARLGGELRITHNIGLETVSLPRLVRIGGAASVHANPDLADLDLSSLARVGGRLDITGNGALEILLIPRHPHAAGRITIDVPRGYGGRHAPGDAGPRVP